MFIVLLTTSLSTVFFFYTSRKSSSYLNTLVTVVESMEDSIALSTPACATLDPMHTPDFAKKKYPVLSPYECGIKIEMQKLKETF